jgi:hypothetical protein
LKPGAIGFADLRLMYSPSGEGFPPSRHSGQSFTF